MVLPFNSVDLPTAAAEESPPTKRPAMPRIRRLPCINLVIDFERARRIIVLCQSAIGTSKYRIISNSVLRLLQHLPTALLRGLLCNWLKCGLSSGFLHHRPMRLGRGQRRRVANALRVAARPRRSPPAQRPSRALGSPLLRRNLFLGRLLLVRAFQVDARPQRLLHQVRAAALRALLRPPACNSR